MKLNVVLCLVLGATCLMVQNAAASKRHLHRRQTHGILDKTFQAIIAKIRNAPNPVTYGENLIHFIEQLGDSFRHLDIVEVSSFVLGMTSQKYKDTWNILFNAGDKAFAGTTVEAPFFRKLLEKIQSNFGPPELLQIFVQNFDGIFDKLLTQAKAAALDVQLIDEDLVEVEKSLAELEAALV